MLSSKTSTGSSSIFDNTPLPSRLPPRGEMNARDAFEVGYFDDEDTKYIKAKFQFTSLSPSILSIVGGLRMNKNNRKTASYC